MDPQNRQSDDQQKTDSEIIEKILASDDRKLFAILYDRYVAKVRKRCRSLVHNSEVSEDLVQDIFIKAIENLPRFRSASSFSTWLYSITYNHCIEYLRNNKRIRFDSWEESIDLPDEVEDEEIEQILALRKERIILLLEMLKPEDKAILLLKYHEGLRIKSIMEILKISGESAAKMKINRAKKRLVALYQEMFAN
jgi:RNA polymerase sigma factor (sigma-70 family)